VFSSRKSPYIFLFLLLEGAQLRSGATAAGVSQLLLLSRKSAAAQAKEQRFFFFIFIL
jgi:hypothetical protein